MDDRRLMKMGPRIGSWASERLGVDEVFRCAARCYHTQKHELKLSRLSFVCPDQVKAVFPGKRSPIGHQIESGDSFKELTFAGEPA